MSTLLELLVEQRKEWPGAATFIVQDFGGKCWPSKGDPSRACCTSRQWASATSGCPFTLTDTASDYQTARVTKEHRPAARGTGEPVDLPKLRLEVLSLDVDIAQYREVLGALLEKRRVAIRLIEERGFRIIP